MAASPTFDSGCPKCGSPLARYLIFLSFGKASWHFSRCSSELAVTVRNWHGATTFISVMSAVPLALAGYGLLGWVAALATMLFVLITWLVLAEHVLAAELVPLQDTPNVMPPTPSGRRRLILVYAGGVVAYLLLTWALPHLLSYIRELPLCQQIQGYRDLAIALTGLFVIVATRWFLYGSRILKVRQLPLPGTLVLFRTPVKRGIMVVAYSAGAVPAFCARRTA